MRLDLYLVEKKLAASRTQAQELIESGFVFLKKAETEHPLKKSNYLVKEEDQIILKESPLQKYVSRGGLKLEGALKEVGLNILNWTVLDIGQSTGGFTDCLLQCGAKKVVGVEVGHSQLHQKLVGDPRVVALENLHVKDLNQSHEFLQATPPGGFDLVVADVSFISLTKVMSHIANFLKLNGDYLLLVKPQFELTAADLDKNGIVKNSKSFSLVQDVIESEARKCFGDVLKYFSSEVRGKDGNQEFFIYGKKTK